MTRRRFAFWIGMGLFGLSERLSLAQLDDLAAALMEGAEPAVAPPPPTGTDPPAATGEMPVHWQTTHNGSWRWLQREHYVEGEWRLTGMTRPVHRTSGDLADFRPGYLGDEEVPEPFRTATADMQVMTDYVGETATAVDEGVSAAEDQPGPDAAPHRRARHGRPPSRWLRSLEAAELSVWLATVDPPEAGVDGMTYLEHLTRDHGFDADRLAGLTEPDQAKLHAAAHHGF